MLNQSGKQISSTEKQKTLESFLFQKGSYSTPKSSLHKKSVKRMRKSILIQIEQNLSSIISKCFSFENNECSATSYPLFLLKNQISFFRFIEFLLCCPIWQCGLFQIPFDIGFSISVCFQAGFRLL